jgi:hypothetical protein
LLSAFSGSESKRKDLQMVLHETKKPSAQEKKWSSD